MRIFSHGAHSHVPAKGSPHLKQKYVSAKLSHDASQILEELKERSLLRPRHEQTLLLNQQNYEPVVLLSTPLCNRTSFRTQCDKRMDTPNGAVLQTHKGRLRTQSLERQTCREFCFFPANFGNKHDRKRQRMSRPKLRAEFTCVP